MSSGIPTTLGLLNVKDCRSARMCVAVFLYGQQIRPAHTSLVYDGTPAARAGVAEASDVRRKPGRPASPDLRIHLFVACAGVRVCSDCPAHGFIRLRCRNGHLIGLKKGFRASGDEMTVPPEKAVIATRHCAVTIAASRILLRNALWIYDGVQVSSSWREGFRSAQLEDTCRSGERIIDAYPCAGSVVESIGVPVSCRLQPFTMTPAAPGARRLPARAWRCRQLKVQASRCGIAPCD